MKLRDLFGDREIRNVLMLAFLIATAILIATKAGQSIGHVALEYLHELAMAVLVALPILITIELFNQRRHARREQETMRDQAIAMIKRDLPASIWNAIEDGVIKCNFFREDHRVGYTLALETAGATPLVIVRAAHHFVLKCGKEPSRRFAYRPEIMFAEIGAAHAAFISLKYGSKALNAEQLAGMSQKSTGHLKLAGIEFEVPEDGIVVEMVMQTACVIDQPFEGIVAVVPTTSLRVDVDAPDGFQVMLDPLHQADMPSAPPRAGYRYAWVQNQGLVQGQGAMLRWEVDRTQLTGGDST
jgi:hypothetical protein